MNPYASYGASTSSAKTEPSGPQGTENTERRDAGDPRERVANEVANARIRELEAEIARLRAAVDGGPRLRVVK